eukprot:TRINITY_DN102921_c0_g1_i1.p1 TRINITY_DN102921_c0_g1~~TRINITY_DN102921_c0_g1_i1.p1  ORF type:complete len:251 (-),score=22.01 TRINITY_DN102921_c0_g1_i1:175-927(-)
MGFCIGSSVFYYAQRADLHIGWFMHELPVPPIASSQDSGTSLPQAVSSIMAGDEKGYSPALRWSHMIIGIGIIATVLCSKFWQWSAEEPARRIGQLMFYHKSLGLLVTCLAVHWTYVRLTAKMPPDLPGSPSIPTQLHDVQRTFKKAVWYILHVVVPILGLTGLCMGYYGGKGVPFFFGILIPGKTEPNAAVAKPSHDIHVTLGKLLCGLIFLHVSGSTLAWLEGQPVVKRMVPLKVLRLWERRNKVLAG